MAVRSFKVVWLGSLHVLKDALDVDVDDDYSDYATLAAQLQTSLMSLIPDCDWHGSIRAFAGPNGPELTLKPDAWSQYYAAFDQYGTGAVDEVQSSIAGSWIYLKSYDGPIVVTRYKHDETFIGHVRFAAYSDVMHLWRLLPAHVKKQPNVLEELAYRVSQYADPGKTIELMPFEAWALPEAHYACALNGRMTIRAAPASLQQSQDFLLKITELLYTYGFCPVLPPRVLNSVFSDVLYEALSPGTYTRDDVLKRARICGDVLLLHGKAWFNDIEIMQAAFESGHYDELAEKLPDELRDNKKFMLKVVQKCGCDLEYASDRLKADVDVCTAACIQDLYAVQYVSKEAIHSNALIHTCFCAFFLPPTPTKSLLDKDVLRQHVNSRYHKIEDTLADFLEQNLVDTSSFYYDCVKANWNTVTLLTNSYVWAKLDQGKVHQAILTCFGKAKWAYLRAVDSMNKQSMLNMQLRSFVSLLHNAPK